MEDGEPFSQKQVCSTCCEPIAKTAKKCIHCDSYQDWRRHLSMGSSVLALLVALVSVIALAVPTLITLATPENSAVEVRLQSLFKEKLYLLAANSGNRPGTVDSVDYSILNSNVERWGKKLDVSPIIVQPNATVQITASINPDDRAVINEEIWRSLPIARDSKLRFNVWVKVKQFFGPRTKYVISVPLSDVIDSGDTAWNDCLMRSFLVDKAHLVRRGYELPTQREVLKICGAPIAADKNGGGQPVEVKPQAVG